MANIMTGVPVSTLPKSEHSSISYAHARVRGIHARTSVQFSSGLSSPLRSVAATSTFKRAFLSQFLSKHSNMVPEQEQQEPALEIKRKAKTREERMAQNKEKCERISHYLRHGKHLPGLTKNQQRIVRGQAKNYILDETSNVYLIFPLSSRLAYIK